MWMYVDVIFMEVVVFVGCKRFDLKMVWKVSCELLKFYFQWWDGLFWMIMLVFVVGGGKVLYLCQDWLSDVVCVFFDVWIMIIDGGYCIYIIKGDEFCDIVVLFLMNGKYVNCWYNGIQDV